MGKLFAFSPHLSLTPPPHIKLLLDVGDFNTRAHARLIPLFSLYTYHLHCIVTLPSVLHRRLVYSYYPYHVCRTNTTRARLFINTASSLSLSPPSKEKTQKIVAVFLVLLVQMLVSIRRFLLMVIVTTRIVNKTVLSLVRFCNILRSYINAHFIKQ